LNKIIVEAKLFSICKLCLQCPQRHWKLYLKSELRMILAAVNPQCLCLCRNHETLGLLLKTLNPKPFHPPHSQEFTSIAFIRICKHTIRKNLKPQHSQHLAIQSDSTMGNSNPLETIKCRSEALVV